MVPILVVGHGGLAEGFRDAVELILGGAQEAFATLALRPEDDPADLARRVEASLDEFGVSEAGEAVVLADLFGASPANAATSLVLKRPAIQVITGVNLAMTLELLVARQTATAAELAELALDRGRDGIRDAGATVRAALEQARQKQAAGETR